MTIIIGSLFLPYTVQFEVGPQTDFNIDVTEDNVNSKNVQLEARVKMREGVSAAKPINITPNSSILPSLSIANSTQQTPISASPRSYEIGQGKRTTYNDSNSDLNHTAEEFFYNHNRSKRISADQQAKQLTDNLNEKLGPQFIQPRSRYSNIKVSSSVVDTKKESDDIGSPSLKINRSSNNLASLNGSSSSSLTNLSASSSAISAPGVVRAKSSLSRQLQGLTLNSNSSTSSLVIAEEQEDHELSSKEMLGRPDDVSSNFNNMVYGRTHNRLAPFGGFSKPDIEESLLCQDNLFEKSPWKVVFSDKGNVSLTKAVKLSVEAGVIKKRRWVGTLAMPSDAVPVHVIDDITKKLTEDYNSDAVFPNDITFQGHYKSFCKQILWPTLHYQIPDDPKSKAFEDHSWGHYRLLNQLIADKIVETYNKENGDANPNDPENMIWIHDYHLLLVPRMVREKLPNAKIGLFLHVSFPSSEVFRCFAQRNALLRGMLGANCISFQTDEYVRHFLHTCNRLLLADTNEFGITYEGKFTSLNTIPVGIDASSLYELVGSDRVIEWRQLIRERWGDQKLIVNRDKLDKLRGIKHKLLAYEDFLKNNPEFIDTTVLIQICIGSSHDPDYEAEIMQIVARINSLPENISVSQPVVMLHKDIEFDQYLALQCEADVFVVSSLREGLNLTCHEFIIATTEKKSPLMLSEFTGSSPLLDCNGKGTLLINPWDIKEFSETFKKSLNMLPDEKLTRWKNCYKNVVTHDSKHWVSSCIANINEAWERDQRRSFNTLIPFTKEVFDKFYKNEDNGKRLFFLNLETPSAISTIGDHMLASSSAVAVARKSASFSEPARLVSLLNDLLSDPQNHAYLISFLKRSDLDRIYRRTPNLGLIAENGGYIKFIGSNRWISIVDESELDSWMPQVAQLIQSKVERLPGSYCEVEDCTIRFHASKSLLEDRERSLDAMGECIQHVNELFQDQDQNGVHATLIKNVVVVQQNQLSLKALKFIISYYNQKKRGIESESLIQEYQVKQVPGSVPCTPITDKRPDNDLYPPILSPKAATGKSNTVSSLFFSGGSTSIDESGFEYLNTLKSKGEVDNVLTVTVLGADTNIRTSANYSVSGKNELLGIMSKVN